MSKVKVLKMITGEDLIAECKDSDDGNIILKNPCILVPAKDGGVGIAPWAFMTKDGMQGGDGIEISNDHILFVAEAQEEIYNQYNEQFGSGLVVPTKKEVAAPDLKLST